MITKNTKFLAISNDVLEEYGAVVIHHDSVVNLQNLDDGNNITFNDCCEDRRCGTVMLLDGCCPRHCAIGDDFISVLAYYNACCFNIPVVFKFEFDPNEPIETIAIINSFKTYVLNTISPRGVCSTTDCYLGTYSSTDVMTIIEYYNNRDYDPASTTLDQIFMAIPTDEYTKITEAVFIDIKDINLDCPINGQLQQLTNAGTAPISHLVYGFSPEYCLERLSDEIKTAGITKVTVFAVPIFIFYCKLYHQIGIVGSSLYIADDTQLMATRVYGDFKFDKSTEDCEFAAVDITCKIKRHPLQPLVDAGLIHAENHDLSDIENFHDGICIKCFDKLEKPDEYTGPATSVNGVWFSNKFYTAESTYLRSMMKEELANNPKLDRIRIYREVGTIMRDDLEEQLADYTIPDEDLEFRNAGEDAKIDKYGKIILTEPTDDNNK